MPIPSSIWILVPMDHIFWNSPSLWLPSTERWPSGSDKHPLLSFLVFNQSPKSDECMYHTFIQEPWICKPCQYLLMLSCCGRHHPRACSSVVGKPLRLWGVSKDRWAKGLPRMLSPLPTHCLFPFDLGFEGHWPEIDSWDSCYLHVFSHLQRDVNWWFHLLKTTRTFTGKLLLESLEIIIAIYPLS